MDQLTAGCTETTSTSLFCSYNSGSPGEAVASSLKAWYSSSLKAWYLLTTWHVRCVYAVGGELTVGRGCPHSQFRFPWSGPVVLVPFVPRGATGTQDQPSQLQNPKPGGQRAQLFKVGFSTEHSGFIVVPRCHQTHVAQPATFPATALLLLLTAQLVAWWQC